MLNYGTEAHNTSEMVLNTLIVRRVWQNVNTISAIIRRYWRYGIVDY